MESIDEDNRGNRNNYDQDNFKVTITYEGSVDKIDAAINGNARKLEAITLELADLREDLRAEQEENDALNIAIIAIDNERHSHQEDVDRCFNADRKAAELSNELANYRGAIDNIEVKLIAASKKLEARDTEITALVKENAELRIKARSFESFLEEAELDKKAITVQNIRLQTENAKLRGELNKPKSDADNFDVNQPVKNWGDSALPTHPNYPHTLLKGTRKQVEQQVHACFDAAKDVPDRKLKAIKILRDRSGLGLKECKDLVECICVGYWSA